VAGKFFQNMNDPTISIDRRSKSFAVFDGLNIIGKFEPYTDEAEALKTAQFRVATMTAKKVFRVSMEGESSGEKSFLNCEA